MDETKNIEIFVAIAKQELNLDWPGAWAEVIGAILENKIDSIIHYENNFNDKEKFQKNWMDTISEHHKLALKGRINFGAVPDNSEKGLLWVLCARAV